MTDLQSHAKKNTLRTRRTIAAEPIPGVPSEPLDAQRVDRAIASFASFCLRDMIAGGLVFVDETGTMRIAHELPSYAE